jgi:glycyl-tRNA synthetase beta chain
MAKNLIFEIGTEEMPAASMAGFRDDYLATAVELFENNNLEFKKIKVYSTPRRLVLNVLELAEKQADNKEIVRGPAVNIAFDDDGQPTRAATGFAGGQGLKVADLSKKDGYLYAEKIEKGVATNKILPEILLKLVKKTPLPKAMRWGNVEMEFIRPIKWLLVLFGSENLALEIAGIKSSNYSMGHRFLSEGKVKIDNAESYFAALKEASIIVKEEERRQLINDQIAQLNLSGQPLIRSELLTEVVDLVEYPTVFKGEFAEKYLELPAEVLITAMEKHQRYFPVQKKEGDLTAEFIGVRDGGNYYLANVIAGNEMVLRGRLDDAQFFFAEDQKYGFLNRSQDIKEIVFQQKLGSVYDKVQKLKLITANLADLFNLSPAEKQAAVRAAELSKNDLATEMVNEFANLQGIMGQEYALLAGENTATAQAIFEHYLPRFADDKLPTSNSGIILALAEKLFNLSSHFLLGNIPSGSQDPFALRRQATGFLRIVLDNKLSFNLEKLLTRTMKIIDVVDTDLKNSIIELKNFIKQRLDNILTEQGVRYDIIKAVINVNDNNLLDLKQRAQQLMEFRSEDPELFVDFIRALVRVKNISDKLTDKIEINAGLLEANEEQELYKAFKDNQQEIEAKFAAGEYLAAFYLLVSLKDQIDKFLDNVMVMVEQEEIKQNRLALLAGIANLTDPILDLEEIALD